MSADQKSPDPPKKDARRRTVYGVEYVTADSLSNLEDWLDANCQGKWSLGLEGMDEKRVKKTVKILFEEEGDKQRFIATFARRRRT
ncbi:MAG: hypothetical protein AAB223_02460 [Pseudomonadota bacterium]